jgi:hypothetical protein
MSYTNSNDMHRANTLINEMNGGKNTVKVIRKERGLLEKDNSSEDKIILAEDNRQILFG